MTFPAMNDAFRIQRLQHPGRKARMVLDTDAYNEIDDQFALTYALLSPEQMTVEAIYAAPFYNDRSAGPGDGMEKSYEEILRLLDFLGVKSDGLAYRGSTEYVGAARQPQENAAVRDMIARALASPDDDPLYVVAIGAITNVASALLLAPEIAKQDRGGLVGRAQLEYATHAGIQPEARCASRADCAGQRRTPGPGALLRRYFASADDPGRVAGLHRRGRPRRRLPVPDIQGIPSRLFRRFQRDLGHLDHRLADQPRVGADRPGA